MILIKEENYFLNFSMPR